ncbi:MAG: ATP-binding cassette domain-containing protein, partial [Oscillospiraceae bacterium]|nr:ATP-binding cassette domain-containing protein [Oscillospiraceae bacterium]
MLKVNDINVYYGAIHAIKGVSFEVRPGEVVTLIGANGAGKSTILNQSLKHITEPTRPRL